MSNIYIDISAKASVGVTFDGGGGNVIALNTVAYAIMPITGRIDYWDLVGDVSGAVQIDVWKHASPTPPVDADSITNGHEPKISASGVYATQTDLSNWLSVDVTESDILGFNVDSVTSMSRVTLMLHIVKT